MNELNADNWFRDVLAAFRGPGEGPLLAATRIEAPPGPLLAIADADSLLLLEFMGQKDVQKLRRVLPRGARLQEQSNAPLEQTRQELQEYFAGERREFTVPLHTDGTAFQEEVWAQLRAIPYGEVIPYAELARRVGRPSAFRAAADANGANRISIIIPCHRVISSDGGIGGYGGGIARKCRLLELEGSPVR